MIAGPGRGGLALLLLAASTWGTAAPAPVTLSNAWMRPAPTDAALARAYVDIASTATLELKGATSPAAQRVEIVVVLVVPSDRDPAPETVVSTLPVPAGATTRLAYRGSHLRLVNMRQDVGNGDRIPITLVFRDASGHESTASTELQVRGLLTPRQMRKAESTGAGQAPASAPTGVPSAEAPESPPTPDPATSMQPSHPRK